MRFSLYPVTIVRAERSKPNTVDTTDITRQINDLKKQIGSKKVEIEKTIKAETDYSEKINQDNEDYNNRLSKHVFIRVEWRVAFP